MQKLKSFKKLNKLFTYCFVAIVLIFSISCMTTDSTTEFRNGMVVSTHSLASKIGLEILKSGGNAVDAAVAVSYALAVVYPKAGNIGGGGFMVIRSEDGIETTIDYREKAPGKAFKDMYLDARGDVIENLNRNGALAAAVPGVVAGTLYALEKYGTKTREEVISPAIKLAKEGFILQHPMGGKWAEMYPETNAIFNKPDGSVHETGDHFIQADMAKTLKAVSEYGRDGFYKGAVAQRIVGTMEKHKGLISFEDLENYNAIEREPVRGTYRGYGIISMPPTSSGGTTLIEILNILERYDITASGFNTPETIHLMAEAERRAFADRNWFIADPDFIDVPVATLTSKAYADKRAEDISTSKSTLSSEIKHGDIVIKKGESEETTHFSIVDKNGMAVSVTTTIERSYGSYLVVEGAGFLLNNEMGDFSAKPGTPNSAGLVYGTANGIAANKRMLSSMTPTIITKNGKNFMVIGTPGGPTIISTVLNNILNVIDHGMTIQESIDAPRFHHQWLPDRIDYEGDRGVPGATLAKLKEMGHTLKNRVIGNAQGIVIDPVTGVISGGADPRRLPPSSKQGY